VLTGDGVTNARRLISAHGDFNAGLPANGIVVFQRVSLNTIASPDARDFPTQCCLQPLNFRFAAFDHPVPPNQMIKRITYLASRRQFPQAAQETHDSNF
jgi:hypothetical protein